MISAKETVYSGTQFRSRIEARWAVFFDALEVEWVYELQHYDFGVKYHWEDWEFKEYLDEELSDCWDYEDRDEVIRDAYRERYSRRMYLPDFWLPDFEHWVEIKGKEPTWEEQTKARQLVRKTSMPITILWGNIPDPHAKLWGECSEIYGGEMNIIALLVLECGTKAMEHAFAAARQARF